MNITNLINTAAYQGQLGNPKMLSTKISGLSIGDIEMDGIPNFEYSQYMSTLEGKKENVTSATLDLTAFNLSQKQLTELFDTEDAKFTMTVTLDKEEFATVELSEGKVFKQNANYGVSSQLFVSGAQGTYSVNKEANSFGTAEQE